MLTTEIVKQAMLTAHDACEAKRKATHKITCEHARPIADNAKLMYSAIRGITSDPDLRSITEVFIAVYSHAFHVGYRAAQLEQEQFGVDSISGEVVPRSKLTQTDERFN